MHFDDRLATVLRQRATGSAMARIQYRQLLDLLGTIPVEARSPRIDSACERLGELAGRIEPKDRVAMLSDPGMRLRNPRLVALLATSEPTVAAAAIEHAQLDDDAWIDLVPALPIHARGLVRQRRRFSPRVEAAFNRLGMAQRSLPPGAAVVEAITETKARDPSEIGAIVRRIEDFRKSKLVSDSGTATAPGADSPFQPHPDVMSPITRAFDFVTDSSGRIIWSDPGMAPMVVGLLLASADPAVDRLLRSALAQHQPINAVVLEATGAPALAGRWQVDATPCFDPASGGFTGFAGRMRRPISLAAETALTASPQDSEADRMRQILHELRTPVGAIQGFAEVIQQQMFGPAPHEYRALAASIAADAARILAGFEELESLAKLESGRLEIASDSGNLAESINKTVAQLKHFTDARQGGFVVTLDPQADHRIAMSQPAADRLMWRLLGTIAGSSSPGEQLNLSVERQNDTLEVSLQLPASLHSNDGVTSLPNQASPASRALSTGMFGISFTLRLASAEAKAAGGALIQHPESLGLRLPGLTKIAVDHSDKARAS